jgi:hypothetical protein
MAVGHRTARTCVAFSGSVLLGLKHVVCADIDAAFAL